MKKFVVLSLIMVLGLGILGLTSCGSNDTELSFAWWGGDMRAEQTVAVIDMFLDQTDNVSYIEGTFAGFGDHWEAMLTRAAAGDLPDVMQQDVARLVEFVSGDLLMDLRPLMADNRIDVRQIPQTIIDAGMVPGSQGVYALPIGMNVIAMVYNRTLLQELGLEAPRNMTLDQFRDLGREIYSRSGVKTNWIGADPSIQLEVHLRAQGVNLFEGTTMGGTPAHYVEYFEFIRQGIEEGWHIHPADLLGRDGAAMNPMWYPPENANLRTWNSPVWSNLAMAYFNDSPADMETAFTTFPSHDPIRSTFGRASMFLSITTHTDNVDEAAEFVSFWLNSVDAHRHMLGERGVIVNPTVAAAVYNDLTPTAQLITEFVEWTNSGNSSPFIAMRPQGAPEVVGTGTGELQRLVDLVGFGELTPQEAAQMFFDFGNATIR